MAAPQLTVAEHAAEAEKNFKLAQLARDVAIAAVAAMQVEQDADLAQEQAEAVLSTEDLEYLGEYNMTVVLDAGPAGPTDGEDPEDSDAEFFEIDDVAFARVEDDEAYLSDEPFTAAVPVPRKTVKLNRAKKLKKLAKGQLRGAIEDNVREKKAQQAVSAPLKKGVQNRQVDTSLPNMRNSSRFSATLPPPQTRLASSPNSNRGWLLRRLTRHFQVPSEGSPMLMPFRVIQNL
ncbi:hypothetical protein DFH07DRAFT_763497 [Mycena maculata]|uniref:Uncharacterized protein n=1 Tax=Mycena maculata TaxID=230809 RepID=A0AAD7KHM8_9AGAR|nr:hypothetical protein DFH07DRAFT_763497 [Mycena maculata]